MPYYLITRFAELIYLPILAVICVVAGFAKKKINIGLGPEPLINNIYHKIALEKHGYSAETFVNELYFITSRFDKKIIVENRYKRWLLLQILHIDFLFAIFRYECLYIYFNGGPLFTSYVLRGFEPWLLKLAQVKTVLMPYGGDVQELSRSPNLLFKHSYTQSYPEHKFRRSKISDTIDLWTKNADHIIGGCEWVDYMYHWDTLMVAHFSIDLSISESMQSKNDSTRSSLRVLHAPNHRAIKGTDHVVKAIDELKAKGLDIELVLLEGLSNEQILKEITESDLVIDQLIIGWYAMFAIEAMTLCKPVICYQRKDLLDLYRGVGLIEASEPPLINADVGNLASVVERLYFNRTELDEYAERGRGYVERIHSTLVVGKAFDSINRRLGIHPDRDKI